VNVWNPNETPEARDERRRKFAEADAMNRRIHARKVTPDQLKPGQMIWLDRWRFKGLYRVVKVTPKSLVTVAERMDWIGGGFRSTGETVRIPAFHTPSRQIWDSGPCRKVSDDFAILSASTLKAFREFLRKRDAEKESTVAA
jgi:hypothetical protein